MRDTGYQMQIPLHLDHSPHDSNAEALNGDLENATAPLAYANLNLARTTG